jgi:lipopolysaccharide transport system permease protein
MIQHLKTVWQFRYFWSSLVQLDLRNRYRRSVLGIGWSLLHPLALTVVFCIAFGAILGNQNWREFAPKLLACLAVWDFLKGSLVFGCDSFIRNEAYIRQSPLPYSIYPLRAVLGTFIHFVISLALVIVAVTVLQNSTDILSRFVAVLPAIVMLTIFCWSIATIAAFLNAYFHDTKHLIEVVTQLLFFLTPIMYDPSIAIEKIGPWIIEFNPAAYFLLAISYPLANGTPVPMDLYYSVAALTAGAFALACLTMSWLQKRLIFQL